ncbi:signal recognition particle subunit SRP68 [Tanacetum coccineum]
MTTETIDTSAAMDIDDNSNPKFSINVLQLLKSSRMHHGLKFSDYTRYRRYCSARLRRLYKSLKFTHGRGKYAKKSVTASTVTEVRKGRRPAMEKKQLPDGPNARQRSYLIEAEAYASYMKGILLFEQDQNLDIALKSFRSARQSSCLSIFFFMKGGFSSVCYLFSLLLILLLFLMCLIMAEALDLSRPASNDRISLAIGHRFPISKWQKLAQDMEKELQDRMEDALPAEKRLAVFDKIFAAYHEARASIRNDLATAGNSENIKDDLSGLDKAIGALLGQRTIERNQLLVSIAKSKFGKSRDEKNEKVTKPEELVRLYDLLLQNTADLSDLLSSGRDRKEEEVALSEECEVKTLAFRAERCFFLAKSYSSAGKRTEAYSLFSFSRSLAETALKKLKTFANHDQVMIKELETLYNDCRSNSCIEHAMGIMEHEKAPEDLSKKISNVSISRSDKKPEKFLIEKLDSYESAVGDSSTKVAPRIAAYQPTFQPVSCNPIVVDLAYNFIDFPSIENRMKKDKKGFISRLWG